jgi:pimeloyl-ACP methyl ester carboxylesterase
MAAGVLLDALAFHAARSGRWGPRLWVRRIEVDGARGLVLMAGQGSPAIVLASPLIRARSYLPLVKALAKHRHVVVVEMPGCGRGSRLSERWSTGRYASWVASLLEQLELTGATVVGHSNSGAVALQLATRCARVSRLVLADSIGAGPKRSAWRVIAARTVDCFKEPLLDLRAWWHLAYNVVVHTRSFAHQVWLASHAERLALARHVRVPTVLAWGSRDGTMPTDGAFRLQSCIAGSRVVIGPGSHDWLITRPQEFADSAVLGGFRQTGS